MKILQFTPVWPSAITTCCRLIGRHSRHEIKLFTFHPKRPDKKEIEQAEKWWSWADLIDVQYFRTGQCLRRHLPHLWDKKKKIISHYNPYSLNEEDWKDYAAGVVVNSYQKSVLPDCHVIPLCIDLDFWTFNRKAYTLEPVVNMCCARIESKKGVAPVGQACKELGYKFLLVGRISDGAYFERVKKVSGSALEFRNGVSDDEVKKAYYQSAVHTCNSIPFFESGCYDDQTEILTDDGWKYFKNLNKSEKVATLNPNTNCLEYHKPYRYVDQDFDGSLYSVENRSMSFAVTPNHNMWISRRLGVKQYEPYRFCRADELPTSCIIQRTCSWEGKTDKDMNWFRFLGIYLAEGSLDWQSTNYCRIHIAAVKKAEKDKIRQLLRDMKFIFKEQKGGFRISKQTELAKYLKQFGKALQKFVPNEVKESPTHCIDEFLTWFGYGDGSVFNGARIFYTSSRRLADDLQECLIKCGNNGNISVRDRIGTKRYIEGRTIIQKNYEYVVHERVKKSVSYIRRGMDLKKIPYKGKVYCVEVQNHILLVRRNNKAMFCGNTMPVLESMACGLPVLTRIQGIGHIPDLYDGKNMHILESKDEENVEEIKAGLKRMIDDRRYRISLRNAAAETAKTRSDKWRAAEYDKLYESI